MIRGFQDPNDQRGLYWLFKALDKLMAWSVALMAGLVALAWLARWVGYLE